MTKRGTIKDQTGRRFGRLVILSLVEPDYSPEHNNAWLCQCDCGKTKVVKIRNMRSGRTLSCGCLAKETLVERNTKHGLVGVKAYRTWKDMRARCNNENDSDFKDYGGRGISVCKEWDDFSVFLSEMGDRPANHTIDRIDVNGDYCKENCRWATISVQANNRRSNVKIEAFGRVANLSEWARETGIKRETISYRIRSGWPPEMALSTQAGGKRPVSLDRKLDG